MTYLIASKGFYPLVFFVRETWEFFAEWQHVPIASHTEAMHTNPKTTLKISRLPGLIFVDTKS